MKSPELQNHHYKVEGSMLGFPLLDHCGYNDLHVAETLIWHEHEGFEFVYVMEGNARYEYDDKSVVDIVGGEFFVTLPGQKHHGYYGMNTPSKMCWLIFNPNIWQDTIFQKNDLDVVAEYCRRRSRQAVPYTNTVRTLLHLFRDSAVKFHSDSCSALNNMRLRSLICQIMIESAESLKRDVDKQPVDYARSIVQRMEVGYADEINIDQIATDLGISRQRLHTVFKESTGQTPLNYLLRMRVEQAQKLLAETQTNITQIAYDTGFSSSQHFCKVFRKYTGLTPSSYRKDQP